MSGLRMRKIEAGVYEEPDGRYRAERVDSMTEYWSNTKQRFVEGTSSVWTITEAPGWTEVGEASTKRECVERIERLLGDDERSER